MTFAQWEAQSPYAGRRIGHLIVVPCGEYPSEAFRAILWRLSDYRVSSVTGGSIVLVPSPGESRS